MQPKQTAIKCHPIRQRFAEILQVSPRQDRLGRATDFFLFSLIALNVIAIILESEPGLHGAYFHWFYRFEVFSVWIFSVEYGLRVWSAVDRPQTAGLTPMQARWSYIRSPIAIVDLLAIAPFYLQFFFVIDLRFLRVLRLLRVLKLTRYSSAMLVVSEVLREEGRVFAATLFILITLLVLASSGIYLIEHRVQPDAFGSIPAAMWWAVSTLTTVGYGDVTPITPLGKIFGSVVTIIGVGMVAMPAAILASGFLENAHRRRARYRNLLDSALQDGHINPAEQADLDQAKQELSLDEEQSEEILRKALREDERQKIRCPHCNQTFLHSPGGNQPET